MASNESNHLKSLSSGNVCKAVKWLNWLISVLNGFIASIFIFSICIGDVFKFLHVIIDGFICLTWKI